LLALGQMIFMFGMISIKINSYGECKCSIAELLFSTDGGSLYNDIFFNQYMNHNDEKRKLYS